MAEVGLVWSLGKYRDEGARPLARFPINGNSYRVLAELVGSNDPTDAVFLDRLGAPLGATFDMSGELGSCVTNQLKGGIGGQSDGWFLASLGLAGLAPAYDDVHPKRLTESDGRPLDGDTHFRRGVLCLRFVESHQAPS